MSESKLSAVAKLNGFTDQAAFDAWCKEQWAQLDAKDAARRAAYAAKLAANERARHNSSFWAAVAAEGDRQLRASGSEADKEQRQETHAAVAASSRPYVLPDGASDD